MAITAAAGGGSWSAGGTWVGGIAPTAADDVILNATSGSVTIDGTSGTPNLCRSLDCTGYTGTLTAGATSVLNIGDAGGGAATFAATMVYTPTAGATVNFVSTTGPNNVTWAGKTHKQINFNGAGGSWVVQDSFSSGANGNIALLQGTLDLNGKAYSVQTFSSNGTLTRTLTMGAATISTNSGGAGWSVTSTGLTLNAGTSNITIGSGTSLFTGGSQTYATVTLSAATSVSGANTFNNLVIGVGSISSFSSDQTCTTLTMNGTVTSRSGITSSVKGTQRTFTVGTVTATGASFRDINAAGAASWNLSAITGFAEDRGNNTGITFTTAGTFYFQTAVSTSYATAAKWFNATNGGGGAGRIPLTQDTGIFDLNSVTAAGVTITMNSLAFGNLNFTGVLNTPTATFSSASIFYGTSVTLDPNMTIAGTAILSFFNRAGMTFDPKGLSMANPFTMDTLGAAVTFLSNLVTTGAIILTTGVWDATGFNVTGASVVAASGTTFKCKGLTTTTSMIANGCAMTFGSGGFTGTVFQANSGANTLDMGTGTWTLSGTGSVWTVLSANMTLNANTSTILISNTSVTAKTFAGAAAFTFYNIRVSGAPGAGTVTFSNAFTVSGTMTFDPNANIIFTKTTTYTIGTVNWRGTAGNTISIQTNTAGVAATISCANQVSCDYLVLKDNTASGNVPFYAGANSTSVSGNTNWTFSAPPPPPGGNTNWYMQRERRRGSR